MIHIIKRHTNQIKELEKRVALLEGRNQSLWQPPEITHPRGHRPLNRLDVLYAIQDCLEANDGFCMDNDVERDTLAFRLELALRKFTFVKD